MAVVVVCKDCGKAILLVTSARAAMDNIEDFDELVDKGHERKDMSVDDAKQLGMCKCYERDWAGYSKDEWL